ncbi:MAG: GTP pyrophosphokinase family protein [Acutalibacteraceae bacterium]|nr:GTP pyrophosphokinase family protein [Acutalibacteraceae bacterium]
MKNDYLEELLISQLPKEDIKNWLRDFSSSYKEVIAYYRCAMMEVATKFNVLNEELSLEYDRNPIETVKTRIKSIESITDKLIRKNLDLTVKNIEEHIHDVAGIRVICSFPDDIYNISQALLKQDDVRLIEVKDYIKNPKSNGYRSLHLIIEIPIFLHDEKRYMKVEVQFRTISMDWWASLEHKIRYKKDVMHQNIIEKELLQCANMAVSLDNKMQEIYDYVIGKKE